MALEKRRILDQIEVKENGVIFCKELNQIVDDGNVISSIPHRSVYCPGEDVSSAPEKVKQAVATFWNEQVIADYKSSQENKLLP